TFLKLALLASAVVSGPAVAQATLALDGQTSVIKELGSDLEFTITAPANQPVALMIDDSAGPVSLFGQSIPLGFTPGLVTIPLGSMPASGTLTFSINLIRSESFHARKKYCWAVALDPGSAIGLAFANGAELSFVARPQLAGNSLSLSPHFEHVAAINRGSSVELGIDPRFTYVDGKTADVWVVESRTATDWLANPVLVDARGAPQTVTFPAGATTIQQNTFVLDSGSLPGPDESFRSADTRIGVGYDVVVDFGQDGNFDPDVDLIDGFDEVEAGFYVVRDTARGSNSTNRGRGPYRVTEILYSGGSFLGQDTYYPENIASLGQLPLVVVSHGNGHDYQWYDHIGYHLASYGYVVMSHQNNTMPGSHTAGTSTLDNTNWFLGNLGSINGGVLQGHVDSSNIVWIGHSRGADGVVRAYDRLYRGATSRPNFSIDDIKLVSSIAPVDFGGWSGASPALGGTGNGSHPHDATFHLWVGQADNDVTGCADTPEVGWYHLHERATHKRQSISLYGVGHGDFHDGGGDSVASGPNLIGRTATHAIMLGYLLPLVEYHVHGDVPSRDFLWRQWEGFRPVGAPTLGSVKVNFMFQDAPDSGKFVIDDFQDQSTVSPFLATSGASVSFDVSSFVEGRADDANLTFTDSAADPFNGFTHDEYTGSGPFRSNSYACVFEYNQQNRQIVYDLTTASPRPNLFDYEYLSFRAAQASRHPRTTAGSADVRFEVSLEDGSGHVGTVRIDAYGGGIEDPYDRSGCGTGSGWTSEYETIRIRLTDFQNDGAGLDLGDVQTLTFSFGPSHGSGQARLGLDEIELTTK
ncbi:MAG: hypothetical protein KDB80_08320, partial [Planctomycetes bacterium]|nr:hypothetical protein [Planctomycetota bacterium]